MPVIAMTREMGSLGRDVALKLCETLQIEPIQHELVAHVAEKMHLRESSVNRFLEGKAGLFERWGINEGDMSLFTSEEILETAERGNVLLRGWGATHVLRKVPHVLCVRVCASLTSRAREVMRRMQIEDLDVAMREVRRNDAAHARAMMHLFHVSYEDSLHYDLVLNTDRLTVDTCVATIRSLAERDEFRETDESRSRLTDLRIEASIRTALRKNATTSQPSPSFEVSVEPGTGRVTLSGIVFDHAFSHTAEAVVMQVPGVSAVSNRLQVIGTTHVGP